MRPKSANHHRHKQAGDRYPRLHYGTLPATRPITYLKALGSVILYTQMNDFYAFIDNTFVSDP
jgi:hypothetical protein